MYKITHVSTVKDYTLELTFDTGERGLVDLAALAGKGVFALWNDMDAFLSVQIGEYGELKWGDVIDLCPDALYLEATGKQPEENFSRHPAGAGACLKISRFYGIVIRMYFNDHNPPHFHAVYGGDQAYSPVEIFASCSWGFVRRGE